MNCCYREILFHSHIQVSITGFSACVKNHALLCLKTCAKSVHRRRTLSADDTRW